MSKSKHKRNFLSSDDDEEEEVVKPMKSSRKTRKHRKALENSENESSDLDRDLDLDFDSKNKSKNKNKNSKNGNNGSVNRSGKKKSSISCLALKDSRLSDGIVGNDSILLSSNDNCDHDNNNNSKSNENKNTLNKFFKTVNEKPSKQSPKTKASPKSNSNSKKKKSPKKNMITIDHFFSQASKKTNFDNLKKQANKVGTNRKGKEGKGDKFDKMIDSIEIDDIDETDDIDQVDISSMNINNNDTNGTNSKTSSKTNSKTNSKINSKANSKESSTASSKRLLNRSENKSNNSNNGSETDEEMDILLASNKKAKEKEKEKEKRKAKLPQSRKRKLGQMELISNDNDSKSNSIYSNGSNNNDNQKHGNETNNDNGENDNNGKTSKTSETSKLKDNKNNETENSSMAPPKKKARFYPGYQRQDAPPMHGQKDIPIGKAYCLSGKKFVITGQLPSLTREECEDLIKQYGGNVTKTVSGVTRYLLVGNDPGESKVQKAKDKKVEMINEDEFLNLLKTLPQKAPPKIKNKSTSKRGSKTPKKLSHNTSNYNQNNNNSNNNNGVTTSGNGNNNNNNNDSNNNKSGELFVDKHKPRSTSELVGNTQRVKDLENFLRNWDRIKNDKSSKSKRACLVSGPPGIGKTTAVRVVASEMGFEIIELNASDTRSRKELASHISDSLNNHCMTEYFGKNKNGEKSNNGGKTVIVMDEVDGMSSGDRGGMAELIKLIKITKTPIICICNDRQSMKVRSLVNYCIDLRFHRPTANQVISRLNSIARQEGLRLDVPALNQVANGVHGDVRQMLHLLQFWSNDHLHSNNNNNNGTMGFQDVKNNMQGAEKDVSMGPWDVMPKFFYSDESCNDAINHFFVDQQLMPLFLHENYLRVTNTSTRLTLDQLTSISRACESVADGDLIDSHIRHNQYYPLLPSFGLLSTLRPARLIMSANVGRCGAQGYQFPMWLGQFSKQRKNERLFNEVSNHMHHEISGGISGGKFGVSLDYLPILKTCMFSPLEKYQENGISNVIDFMKEYGLSREDWNSISELGVGYISPKNRPINIATKVKSAFTRQCNHELNAYAKNNGLSGKGSKAPTINVNEDGDPIDEATSNSTSDDDNDDNDDTKGGSNDLKNDNLIKVKKQGVAKKGAKSKKASKAATKTKAKTKSKTKSKATGKGKGTRGKNKK